MCLILLGSGHLAFEASAVVMPSLCRTCCRRDICQVLQKHALRKRRPDKVDPVTAKTQILHLPLRTLFARPRRHSKVELRQSDILGEADELGIGLCLHETLQPFFEIAQRNVAASRDQ